jgi:type II secretory pathway pseudopilin PulG
VPGGSRKTWRRRGRKRSPRRGEGGFALLEVAVAASILLTVLTGIGTLLGGELVNVGRSAAEQTANGLLTQAMEQVRALPFQIVVDGLSATDATIATDPNIQVTGHSPNQTYTYKPAGCTPSPSSGCGETIPVASPYTQAPFNPHLSQTTIEGIRYTVAAYPTLDSEETGFYRVTVTVSWTPAKGVSSISAQTFVYSPTGGCLTDTNHPFAAPCQPFFYAQAASLPGNGLTVSGTVAGLNLTDVALYGPQAQSALQMEQSTSVLGSVTDSEGLLTTLGVTTTVGGSAAASAADNDPGTHSAVSQSSSAPSQSQSQTLTLGSLLTTGLSVIPGLLDSGTTVSTVDAGASPACDDLAGHAQQTGFACGSSSVTQGGAAAVLSGVLSAIGLPLVNWSPSTAAGFAAYYGSSGSSYCTTTSGDGCVHSAATRTLGTVQLAGLPALVGLTFPVGWGLGNIAAGCPTGNYFAALVGYSDTVTAESGVNAAAPSGTVQNSPKLCYWNGSSYQATTVVLGSSPQALAIPTLSVGIPAIAAVTITPSLSFGTVMTTQSTNSGCSSACTATAQATSPITGSLEVQVVLLGVTLADVTLSVDFGSAQARSSYQAAP